MQYELSVIENVRFIQLFCCCSFISQKLRFCQAQLSPLNLLKWTQLSLTLLDESKLVSVFCCRKAATYNRKDFSRLGFVNNKGTLCLNSILTGCVLCCLRGSHHSWPFNNWLTFWITTRWHSKYK